MFKTIKAVYKILGVMGKIVGFLVALEAIIVAVGLAFGFKHEAKRGGNKIEVQENVSYTRKNPEDVAGLTVTNGFIAFAKLDVDGTPIIVTDEIFDQFPEKSQEAIIAHEEGHIVLGHLKTMNAASNGLRTLYPIVGKVQPVEIEADAYAAKKTSPQQVIEMLEMLKKLPGINHKELDLRIKALQK